MLGTTVCRHHGGAARQVREAGKRRQAEVAADAMMVKIWNPNAEPVTNNVEAMKLLAGQLKEAIDVVGERLRSEALDGATPIVWGRLLREFRQLLLGMERLGIEQAYVELEAARAQLVTSALLTAFNSVELLPADRSTMINTFLKGIGRDPEATRLGSDPVAAPLALDVVRGEVE